jgi:folylpolyglutamate synthase/dihydropteroate synthase
MSKRLGEELLGIAQEGYNIYQQEKQMVMQKQNEPENEQQLGSMQLSQPG